MSIEKRNIHGFPEVETTAREGSTQTTKIVQILNSALPWCVLLAIIACTGFGMAWATRDRANDINETVADLRANYATRFEQQRDDFTWKIDELRKAAEKSEREMRMLEYYVVDTDAKLVKRGALKQSETWSATRGKK
jgi:hypothetical protein